DYVIRSAVPDAPSYELGIGSSAVSADSPTISGVDGLLTRRVASAVRDAGATDDAWKKSTSREFLTDALGRLGDGIKDELAQRRAAGVASADRARLYAAQDSGQAALSAILK